MQASTIWNDDAKKGDNPPTSMLQGTDTLAPKPKSSKHSLLGQGFQIGTNLKLYEG
jgi:hypothetical protein